jgi:type VI protein secretion system component VasF
MALASSSNRVKSEGRERPLSPKEEMLRNKRRQRLRSYAIAWALFALAVMFFLVTIVRLGANVANRPI